MDLPRVLISVSGLLNLKEGAGTFVVIWISFLFLWSIPLIIGEYAIGIKYRRGVLGSFIESAGKKFAWMGAFVAFVATAITFFYSVIVGWCIYYFLYMIIKPLPLTLESSMMIWDQFQAGGWPLLFHALAMGLGALAIWKGIHSIERVNKILVPTLLVIVGISYLLGIPSARNLNFLSNQDFVWGLALMLSGAFVAFMLIKHGLRNIRILDITQNWNDWRIGIWWEYIIRFFIPVAVIILLVWWLVMAGQTDEWFNPLRSFSLATCLVQWALIIIIMLMLNKYMSQKLSVDKM